MKKLFVLSLVVFMVVSMGIVSLAKDIDVKMEIDKTTHVIVGGDGEFNLVVDSATANADATDTLPITIQTNCLANLTIENNFDYNNAISNLNKSDYWPYASEYNKTWILAPNVVIKNHQFDLQSNQSEDHTKGGESITVNSIAPGEYDFDLMYEINVNDDSKWFDLAVQDYGKVGTVVVTVAAE